MRDKILAIYATAILLGLIVGVIGSFFQIGINLLTNYLNQAEILLGQGKWALFLSIVSSMFLAGGAFLLMRKFAPEASGSGVQEIEGALLHQRTIYWRRLIPIKFLGGIMAISSKLVLGREGPTIQIGGNLGDMLGDIFGFSSERRDALIAAGAAAGLAAAFNAPLAGVLFVLEEMRSQFNFSFINLKTVAIACMSATISLHFILGSGPDIVMPIFSLPSLESLILFFFFGIIMGLIGLYFNKGLMFGLKIVDKMNFNQHLSYVLLVAALIGTLAFYYPDTVGGGYNIIHQALTINSSLSFLLVVFLIRYCLSILSYSTTVPGGIFAPMLALGTIIGTAFYTAVSPYIHDSSIYAGMFAVAGMGSLFAAAVRAPITGIILVVEITQNYSLILPLMVSCLTSTTILQLAGNPPIYTQLLERTMRKAGFKLVDKEGSFNKN